MKLQMFIAVLVLALTAGCQSSGEKKQVANDKEKRAAFHYRLGIDALHKGLLPKAFEELLLSEQINPKNPETLDAIAYAWRLRGNTKQSKDYYERAIDHDAGSATHNNYGSLLIEMGEYKKAEKHLKIALEDPRYRNQSLAFVNLGDAYVGMKKLEDAVRSYRKAQMLAPNWVHPQLREASAYAAFNRYNYAQALYETVLRKEPANQPAMIALIALVKEKTKAKDGVLKKYLNEFIKNTTDEMQKAWAKDELASL